MVDARGGVAVVVAATVVVVEGEGRAVVVAGVTDVELAGEVDVSEVGPGIVVDEFGAAAIPGGEDDATGNEIEAVVTMMASWQSLTTAEGAAVSACVVADVGNEPAGSFRIATLVWSAKMSKAAGAKLASVTDVAREFPSTVTVVARMDVFWTMAVG